MYLEFQDELIMDTRIYGFTECDTLLDLDYGSPMSRIVFGVFKARV